MKWEAHVGIAHTEYSGDHRMHINREAGALAIARVFLEVNKDTVPRYYSDTSTDRPIHPLRC